MLLQDNEWFAPRFVLRHGNGVHHVERPCWAVSHRAQRHLLYLIGTNDAPGSGTSTEPNGLVRIYGNEFIDWIAKQEKPHLKAWNGGSLICL
jgi:hypothetical protein